MNMQQQVLGTAPVSLPRACRSQQRKAARHIQPVKAVVMDAPPSDKLQNGHSENQIRNGKVGTTGPTIINGQILHSMTAQQLDAVRSMEDYVEAAVVPNLKDVSKCWQPADYLPDPSSPDFLDEVAELQKRTNLLPDDYFVVLVGDMITEEALPTYMAMLNTLDGVRDETGAADTPWGRWNRAWTAEENRHGDLMNKYCWLSGRVNMKAVEVTIQNLIGSGMDPKTENNPYLGFIYTSFQERATAVSHGATARHALELGDKTLGRICGAIASDEKRHERAYCMIVSELFRRDPSGTILAFADMMKKKIVMPAHMMDDHEHMPKTGRGLFSDFSAVAQSTGTYTAVDYADIMMHLIKLWKIEGLTGLSPEAEAAQDWLCKQPPRIRRLAERDLARTNKPTINAPFSWIFNREIELVPSKY